MNDPLCWPGAGRVPGVLTILSCPPPLCPHVEFAVAAALGVPAPLDWSAQPARPTMAFAALEWRANAGAAGLLASRLRQLGAVTFEVVEGPAEGCDAHRYAYTPELGLFHGASARTATRWWARDSCAHYWRRPSAAGSSPPGFTS